MVPLLHTSYSSPEQFHLMHRKRQNPVEKMLYNHIIKSAEVTNLRDVTEAMCAPQSAAHSYVGYRITA